MTTETKVTCDQCGSDLTYTGDAQDYSLMLGSRTKNHMSKTMAVTSTMIYPPVDRTYDFCGIGCLSAWLPHKYPNAADEYARHVKHKEWLERRKASQ